MSKEEYIKHNLLGCDEETKKKKKKKESSESPREEKGMRVVEDDAFASVAAGEEIGIDSGDDDVQMIDEEIRNKMTKGALKGSYKSAFTSIGGETSVKKEIKVEPQDEDTTFHAKDSGAQIKQDPEESKTAAKQLQDQQDHLDQMARVDVDMRKYLEEVIDESDPMTTMIGKKNKEEAIGRGDFVSKKTIRHDRQVIMKRVREQGGKDQLRAVQGLKQRVKKNQKEHDRRSKSNDGMPKEIEVEKKDELPEEPADDKKARDVADLPYDIQLKILLPLQKPEDLRFLSNLQLPIDRPLPLPVLDRWILKYQNLLIKTWKERLDPAMRKDALRRSYGYARNFRILRNYAHFVHKADYFDIIGPEDEDWCPRLSVEGVVVRTPNPWILKRKIERRLVWFLKQELDFYQNQRARKARETVKLGEEKGTGDGRRREDDRTRKEIDAGMKKPEHEARKEDD